MIHLFYMIFKHSFYLILTLSIFSCATTAKTNDDPATSTDNATTTDTAKPNVPMNTADNWQIKGKLGVQTPRNSISATVDWVQKQGQYQLNIQGPVGTPGMQLTGNMQQATLKMSDGKVYRANSPEQLLAKHWGYQLPVSNLYYWIRGLPVPNIPAKQSFDRNHRLTQLTQSGWHLNYLAYTKVGNVYLPSRIYAYSSSLTAKLVIYEWHLG